MTTVIDDPAKWPLDGDQAVRWRTLQHLTDAADRNSCRVLRVLRWWEQ